MNQEHFFQKINILAHYLFKGLLSITLLISLENDKPTETLLFPSWTDYIQMETTVGSQAIIFSFSGVNHILSLKSK